MAEIAPGIPLALLVLRAGREILPLHCVMRKVEEDKVWIHLPISKCPITILRLQP